MYSNPVAHMIVSTKDILFCQRIWNWQKCSQNWVIFVVNSDGNLLFPSLLTTNFTGNLLFPSLLTTNFTHLWLHFCQSQIRWQNKISVVYPNCYHFLTVHENLLLFLKDTSYVWGTKQPKWFQILLSHKDGSPYWGLFANF